MGGKNCIGTARRLFLGVSEGILIDFKKDQTPKILVVLFILARLMQILSSPTEGFRGYGDFIHFYHLAALPGWPFINYWVEFPPLFPFLSAVLYRLSGAQQHTYDYLLAFILMAVDSGNLFLFIKITLRLHPAEKSVGRILGYYTILVALAYSWWYFDPLAVLALLAGIYLLIEKKFVWAGFAFGAGLLIKLFPILGLVMAWKTLPWQKAALISGICLGSGLIIYGGLLLASPEFTRASLISQGSKGSWETVWALLDGNYRTGNFGPEIERLDVSKASQTAGNSPRVPVWITLPIFAAIGLWGFWKARITEERQGLALIGWTWSLFLLWSPGWSPQWILYLLPLVLLVFNQKRAFLFALVLVFINLLEWPVLLSRGLFWSLNLTVIVRTLILLMLAFLFFQEMTLPNYNKVIE
jgi:hypothetical protein